MKRSIVIFTSLMVFAALAAFAPTAHARRSAKQQRIQACSDKSAGDPCEFTHKGESVNGTCESGRRGKLMCTASNSGMGTSESSSGAMNNPSGTSAGSESSGTMGEGGGNSGNTGATGGAMGSPSTGSTSSGTSGAAAPGTTTP